MEAEGREGVLGGKVSGVIPRVSVIVGAVGLCLMVVLVVAGIIARSVFNYSIPFAIEYAEYLIPVIAFWGAAYTLRKEGHVNADIILHRLPDKLRQWFIVVGYLLGMVYLVILIIYTSKLASTSIRMHYLSMYPTQTLIGYVQWMVPIGLSLFAIQLVIEIIRKARLLYLNL